MQRAITATAGACALVAVACDDGANAALARDMRFGNVDQHVCAEARFFAGNVFSSFTHHVCYLRVLRGVPAACVGSDVYGREADPRTEWV